MIKEYIQSLEAQDISNRIHFTRMNNQYSEYVWNGNPEDVPENKATPERIQEIWSASKLFLDCTESEAIEQYSLVGLKNGVPVVPLEGVTNAYAKPFTIEGNENCIPVPDDGIENYDLSEFTYDIIEIEINP